MQYTGNSGYVLPTLLRQIDMGYLTCAQIWVRAVHTKGGQAQAIKYAPELTWRDRKTVPHPAQFNSQFNSIQITSLSPPADCDR